MAMKVSKLFKTTKNAFEKYEYCIAAEAGLDM
jgi:hypothetical protein